MTTNPNRRTFLRESAASCVLGWSLLHENSTDAAAQQPAPQNAIRNIWTQAQRQMRDRARPGLIIIVPDEAPARQQLANDFGVLLGGHRATQQVFFQGPPPTTRDTGIDRLLSLAVFVCLPGRFARTIFPNMPAQTALVVVDHSGNPLAYQSHDANLFQRRTVRRLSAFIHGAENRRLVAFAQAQRTAIGDERSQQVARAITNLGSRVFRTRQAAVSVLTDQVTTITAILSLAHAEANSLEMHRRLDLLLAHAIRPPGTSNAEPLPYGVSWEMRPIDRCPFCGSVAVPNNAREFLRLLRFTPENG